MLVMLRHCHYVIFAIIVVCYVVMFLMSFVVISIMCLWHVCYFHYAVACSVHYAMLVIFIVFYYLSYIITLCLNIGLLKFIYTFSCSWHVIITVLVFTEDMVRWDGNEGGQAITQGVGRRAPPKSAGEKPRLKASRQECRETSQLYVQQTHSCWTTLLLPPFALPPAQLRSHLPCPCPAQTVGSCGKVVWSVLSVLSNAAGQVSRPLQ